MKISAIVTLKKEVLDPQGKVVNQTLKDMGYENIAHIEGGFAAMRDSGFNIVDKKD